ncbi:MAG: sigma-70 family RNA polymerase sigma factor [Candidatus Coproplasma sp.]
MAENKLTDEQLISAFRRGDGNACEEILLRYKNKVLAIARGYFLSDGDTEDLVQEGMCGLYSAITAFGGEGSFAPFAYACIRNRIVDAFKHSKGSSPALVLKSFSEEEEGGVSLAFSPEDALINSEESKELNELMKASLSKLELKAIEMYVEGATMNEMATSLNLTYKQLDNALSRAKRKLKNIRKNK